MPYSNPDVIRNSYLATQNRTNPLDAGRARHQDNIQNQFRDRQISAQEQNSETNQQQAQTQQKELARRMFKDIHDMGKDKRTKASKELERSTSELLYAQQQGPEAWDQLMQKRAKQEKKTAPFEQAPSLIGPGVGLGNAFEMYQKGEARAAAQKLENSRVKSTKDKRTKLERNVAMLTSGDKPMTRKEALKYLNWEENKSPEDLEQSIMHDITKNPNNSWMDKADILQAVQDRMSILKQVREAREAEDPSNPLGLPRGAPAQ